TVPEPTVPEPTVPEPTVPEAVRALTPGRTAASAAKPNRPPSCPNRRQPRQSVQQPAGRLWLRGGRVAGRHGHGARRTRRSFRGRGTFDCDRAAWLGAHDRPAVQSGARAGALLEKPPD